MEGLIMVINVCPLWKYVTEAVYFSYFGAICSFGAYVDISV